jgi:hypothetical protein
MRQHPFFHMHKIQQCKFTFQESLDSKTISGYAISILTLSSPFKYAHISFLSRMETPGTRALFQDIPESRIMLKGLQDFVRSSDALSIRFSFFLYLLPKGSAAGILAVSSWMDFAVSICRFKSAEVRPRPP